MGSKHFAGKLLRRLLTRSCCLLLMLGFAASLSCAQVDSSRFVGTVVDSSGAAVIGATVTVTNSETNISSKTTTDEQGEYTLPQLKPGVYSLSVESQGFKTAVQSGIKLDISHVARIDFALAPGTVTERVEVSAGEPLVESQTSSIGQVIEEAQVHDLPLNGRNFLQLAYLSPGVNQGQSGIVQQGNIPENERGNGAIQVNGLMATNNNFLLNGFDNNEQQIGFEVLQPPVDAIQEFKVQTSNFGADIGKGGAVVNVVLKSGSNGFHGSVFEFLRNSAMDAKNFFDNSGTPIAPFKQNQFGGTLGGPILKNKTFFFMDYQGTRIRQSQTAISTVPTLAERTGNFSDLLGTDANGNITGQIYDPLSTNPNTGARTAFPGNIIPSCVGSTGRSASGGGCLDPVALNLVNLYPAPNIAGAGTANNFLYNPVASNNQDAFDVRVDQQWRADSLSFMASFGTVSSVHPDPFPGEAGGGGFSGNINNKSLVAGISDVHVFSPTKSNELKIGYTRYAVNAVPFFSGVALATQFGIPGINNPNNLQLTGGLPNIMISGYSSIGNQDYFPEILNENNYQLKDSFTWIRGRHTMKMGGDLIRRQHGFFQTQNTRGDFTFNQLLTSDINTNDTAVLQAENPGASLASFLVGYPISSFRDGLTGLFGMKWWEFSSYFMDDFRVSPRLTLNLGLRYDLFTPMVEDYNRLANFDFATGNFVSPSMPGVSNTGNVATNRKNFAPRLGFAYTPSNDGKTVIHGAYGIFYSLQADQSDGELAYNPTDFFSSQTMQLNASSIPVMRLSTGFATPQNPTGGLTASSLSAPSGRASAVPFHNPTPYVQEWNLNVERQLAKELVLQVGYVGIHAVHLTYLRNLNQALQPLDSNFMGGTNFGRPYFSTVPQIAAIRTSVNDISTSMNSLQARLEKRFSAGWTLLTSYTYQHTIGLTEEDETAGGSAEPQNTYNMRAERGSIGPDFRHQLTTAASYELPFGPGKRFLNSNSPLRWFAGGWQANAIITMYSGQAFTPLLSFDPTNTGSGGARPDIVGNPYSFGNATSVGCPSNQQSLQCWYNPTAFALPALAPGQTTAHLYGNAGRGILRGPAQHNVDLSLFKEFKFRERLNLQFRAEAFNVLNTPEFGIPNAYTDLVGSAAVAPSSQNPTGTPAVAPLAGSITSTVHGSRQLQVALQLKF